jgi:GT2 family glycosyltransferase
MSHDTSPTIPAAHAALLDFPLTQEVCPTPTVEVPWSKPAPALAAPLVRPKVRGKFLFAEDEKLFVRGVTYGTFRPNVSGEPYPHPALVEEDFADMAASGVNAIRTYTPPPRWLLDAAGRRGLRVMVGLSWEDHVAFLEERDLPREITRRVRQSVRSYAGHPALLCYVVANEIPGSIVRWHGPARIERLLHRLSDCVRVEDSDALVTYVNFPTTEYLRLPFVDVVSFNVYLERREALVRYLHRMHNLAGDRPLLLAELGLDSRRNGTEAQARALDWQVRCAFEAGCAGTFLFAWTDEWHRGGHDIDDWDFGLVTRGRAPKPALETVRRVYEAVPFGGVEHWPPVSVVVCTYNGTRTIRETLTHLALLDYPDYEVIVIDDGSTDTTANVAGGFDVRLIRTENCGLSSARNTALAAARGQIIAYIDDDAYPDQHWLRYLALKFLRSDHVAVGGPNLAAPNDGLIADCVANAPGNPTHILIDDDLAEHIPGCNMALRKQALEAIGGFDSRFRATADDVDVCWRLQDRGWSVGFSPAALVWHHRRASVWRYLKQQFGYGRGESLLELKWPPRHGVVGQVPWCGRIYGKGLSSPLRVRPRRVYYGVWGGAAFQSLYERAPGVWSALLLMPEWYLVVAFLLVLSALGLAWTPMLVTAPLTLAAIAAPLIQAVLSGSRAEFQTKPLSAWKRLELRALTAILHVLQPVARLAGRLRYGLTPWRHRGRVALALPRARRLAFWDDTWASVDSRLTSLTARLAGLGAAVRSGSAYDRWDLEVRGGLLGSVRGLMAIEEHGAGRQLIRFRLWPRVSGLVVALAGLFGVLALAAVGDGALLAATFLGVMALGLALRACLDCAVAAGSWLLALRRGGKP